MRERGIESILYRRDLDRKISGEDTPMGLLRVCTSTSTHSRSTSSLDYSSAGVE